MNRTRETYETLNTELHQDLPDLYDSRVVLSTDVIGSIATAEKEFFTELAQVNIFSFFYYNLYSGQGN